MYSLRMSFCIVPDSSLGGHALAPRHRHVEREQDGRRGVDRHRGGHPVERDALEQVLHVLDRARSPRPPCRPRPARDRRVGVVAHLGRQVEGHRQPGLALVEQEPVALVRLGGRAEAGVLAHRPAAAAVHGRVHAARERILARAPRPPRRRAARRPARRGAGGGCPTTSWALACGRRRSRSRPHNGMLPCLLRWVGVALGLQHVEQRAQARARVARLDHLVDVAALGGDVGVGELRRDTRGICASRNAAGSAAPSSSRGTRC